MQRNIASLTYPKMVKASASLAVELLPFFIFLFLSTFLKFNFILVYSSFNAKKQIAYCSHLYYIKILFYYKNIISDRTYRSFSRRHATTF